MKFLNNLYHRFCKKYTSIHNLPIYNWNKIHETGDLGYLFLEYKKSDFKGLIHLWDSIYSEYIKEFGLSKEYKEILKLKVNIAKQKADYISTGDRIKLNFIALDESRLQEIEKKEPKQSIHKTLMHIEKAQGVRITDKNTTVYEFYNYINNING